MTPRRSPPPTAAVLRLASPGSAALLWTGGPADLVAEVGGSFPGKSLPRSPLFALLTQISVIEREKNHTHTNLLLEYALNKSPLHICECTWIYLIWDQLESLCSGLRRVYFLMPLRPRSQRGNTIASLNRKHLGSKTALMPETR